MCVCVCCCRSAQAPDLPTSRPDRLSSTPRSHQRAGRAPAAVQICPSSTPGTRRSALSPSHTSSRPDQSIARPVLAQARRRTSSRAAADRPCPRAFARAQPLAQRPRAFTRAVLQRVSARAAAPQRLPSASPAAPACQQHSAPCRRAV